MDYGNGRGSDLEYEKNSEVTDRVDRKHRKQPWHLKKLARIFELINWNLTQFLSSFFSVHTS